MNIKTKIITILSLVSIVNAGSKPNIYYTGIISRLANRIPKSGFVAHCGGGGSKSSESTSTQQSENRSFFGRAFKALQEYSETDAGSVGPLTKPSQSEMEKNPFYSSLNPTSTSNPSSGFSSSLEGYDPTQNNNNDDD